MKTFNSGKITFGMIEPRIKVLPDKAGLQDCRTEGVDAAYFGILGEAGAINANI